MSSLATILRMRLSTLKNKAVHLHRDSVAKIFVVLFGLLNVIGIGFYVSYVSFEYIEAFAAFGSALNAKMVGLLFFALLILVVLSTIIVAYTTIFLARETEFLFQYPVAPRTVLLLKISEAVTFSSWASLFLCLPVLVAYGCIRRAPPAYYLEMLVVLVVFLLFAGVVGTSLSLLLAPAVRRLSPRQLMVAGAAFLAVLGWVFLRSFNVWDMDGENNLLILDRFTAQFAALNSPFSPSHWAGAAILASAAGDHREVLFQASTLLANTLVFLPLVSWYGKRLYGGQWIASRSHPARDMRLARRVSANTRGSLAASPWRNPIHAIAVKDMLVFIRDPAQISQSILFILLMVIYSLSLLRIPDFMITGNLRRIVYFANLGAVCMILSSFTSRFLFPLLSLEGKAFWIVGLAPIPRVHLLHEKALFGLGVSLTLGMILTVVSNAVLHSSPSFFLGAVYTMVLASVCLTSLSTGLGSAYPAMEEDNPARIAVGLGGTLNFFASALSVAILIGIESAPYIALGNDPGAWRYASHGAALAFTAGLSLFCFKLGCGALTRREF